MKSIFKGAGVAIVTPMKPDGSVNFKKMEELIEYQIMNKTDAVIVAGTTGEASTLTTREQIQLIEFTVKVVNGRVPVIAGAGSNNTNHAAELCDLADEAGADALLLVTPYYNKCSQEGLYRHYEVCSKMTGLPFILYNIPGRTGVNIIPSTYEKLLKIPNIVAVKEASGNFSQIAKIASLYQGYLDIYSGNDDQITSSLALGAKGVISVLSNVFPETVHDICYSFFEGDAQRSDFLQLQYLDLIEALFSDINPIPVKEALNILGWDVGGCRLPLCPMAPELKKKLYDCLIKHQAAFTQSNSLVKEMNL